MGCCALGPVLCRVGAGITAGQLLGGAAILGGGASGLIILKEQSNQNPPSSGPQAPDFKKLSPGETRNLEKGGDDVHELKGGTATGQTGLYKDRNGEIYILPKGGSGGPDPIGMNIKDF